jgi:hypothetical protein
MMPRTPTGDLVAALVLFGAVALLVYVALKDGRLGLIDRHEHPTVFWLSVGVVSLSLAGIAALLAWEALATLLGG